MSNYNDNVFKSFSTSSSNSFANDFMESNSVVMKFIFLLLVVFVFVLLLRFGIYIMSYLFKPTESPHLIDGMVSASQEIIFEQDPSNNSTAATIYRSVNASDGIEFTWSIWLFLNNFENTTTYKHVFNKGNWNTQENGIAYPNNAPGLYITPHTNNLVVIMNTFNVINEEILIPDIPINKWMNVIIRCQNTTMDVYINGTISRSINLIGVPKQNYGNVYVAMNGGFDGYISNLWYYNYALGVSEIQKITDKGPNTTMIGSSGVSDNVYNYLSLRWFFHP